MRAPIRIAITTLSFLCVTMAASAQFLDPGQVPRYWTSAFPLNGFEQATINVDEIMSGGPGRDGIRSIDAPTFTPISQVLSDFIETEPVLSLEINGDARAYPLGILTRHEIANDIVGGVPVAVTFCPLCNSGIAYERIVNGEATEFGVSGLLRNSDMVMYDRQTETFWQQFTGEGIVGPLAGAQLTAVPIRMESVAKFAARHPNGLVLDPPRPGQAYKFNPYGGYDGLNHPFLYFGSLPDAIPALARVVAVEDTAWSLESLRQAGQIDAGDLRLTWTEGQNSALDTSDIRQGKDVGNVVVQRLRDDGIYHDVVHDVTFAFTFHAFRPHGRLIF